jgi:hypothetical protein
MKHFAKDRQKVLDTCRSTVMNDMENKSEVKKLKKKILKTLDTFREGYKQGLEKKYFSPQKLAFSLKITAFEGLIL